MYIDQKHREIVFKIVYYGPGLGGKTTNLEYIHSHIQSNLRSDLISFKTKEGRTLYFDFMQVGLNSINGKRPRFHLYTVPGQTQYAFGRKLIVKGADAIVFVADSQKSRMEDNVDSKKDLQTKLHLVSSSLDEIPWIIQYNKRDLPLAAPVYQLQRELNPENVPFVEAVASQGIGVFETLKHAIRITVASK